jgi:hypothetical protein
MFHPPGPRVSRRRQHWKADNLIDVLDVGRRQLGCERWLRDI